MRNINKYVTYIEYEGRLLEVFTFDQTESDDVEVYYKFVCFDLFEETEKYRPVRHEFITKELTFMTYEGILNKYPEYFV